MNSESQVEQYLSDLRSHLSSSHAAERDEIVREIAAHIRDAAAECDGDAASVLALLGSPQELASQYRGDLLLRQASRSVSPLLLARAAVRLATKGVFGIFVLFCAIFGYSFGFGAVLVGLIKPFAPAHTGFWMKDGVMVASGALVEIPLAPAHEVLGWWLIPIALVIGLVLIVTTNLTIRHSLRAARGLQAHLKSGPRPAPVRLSA